LLLLLLMVVLVIDSDHDVLLLLLLLLLMVVLLLLLVMVVMLLMVLLGRHANHVIQHGFEHGRCDALIGGRWIGRLLRRRRQRAWKVLKMIVEMYERRARGRQTVMMVVLVLLPVVLLLLLLVLDMVLVQELVMSRLLLLLVMMLLLLLLLVKMEMGVVVLLMISGWCGHGHRGRRSGRRTVILFHFEPYARGGVRLLETRQLEPRRSIVLVLLLVIGLLLLFGRVRQHGVHVRQRVDLVVQRQLGIRTGQQFGKTARRECGLCLE
jgi:hypothetical protein